MMTEPLSIKSKEHCRWDLVSLGEVMLRLDPGAARIHAARSFQVWEGGGEYNVARGLKRCFGMDAAVVTALADNPVGRLVQDLMYQGGVDQSHVRWVKYDGVGRAVRNGLNFTERGFGLSAALGCSDRGHTAVSQMRPGDVDWQQIFGREGARWFHTGGIFCALSETTPLVAREAMTAARQCGTVVSYDLNYRDSLWKSIGGKARAQEVNRELAPLVDVMIGNEEDFTAALGLEVAGVDEHLMKLDVESFRRMIERAVEAIKEGGVSILEITMTVPGALRMIETVSARYGGEALVGAGTVLDAETARHCILSGAQFVVSPALDLVPTGGVSLKTAADFITAGASALGVGADLVDTQALRDGQPSLITQRARQFVEIVKQAREAK